MLAWQLCKECVDEAGQLLVVFNAPHQLAELHCVLSVDVHGTHLLGLRHPAGVHIYQKPADCMPSNVLRRFPADFRMPRGILSGWGVWPIACTVLVVLTCVLLRHWGLAGLIPPAALISHTMWLIFSTILNYCGGLVPALAKLVHNL